MQLLESTNPTIVFGFCAAAHVLSIPWIAWFGVAWLVLLTLSVFKDFVSA